MNTIHGAFFFASSNKSRTREAPTPTNISTKSEPEIEKNGTFASPAIAFAKRVLPVPGGPSSKTPFGILAPTFVNFPGSLKKSTISCRSSFSSFSPATSFNVTLLSPARLSRARLLPKFIILLPPFIWAFCAFIIMKIRSTPPTVISAGRMDVKNILSPGTSLTIVLTPAVSSSSSTGLTSDTTSTFSSPEVRCTSTEPVGTSRFCTTTAPDISPASSI